MNFLASGCNSDCESGWTLYLEQSSPSSREDRGNKLVGGAKSGGFCDYKGKNADIEEEEEDEEEGDEEDLSMVSDASSGPPHFNENEGYFNCDNVYFFPVVKQRNNGGKRQKMKEHRRGGEDQELPSCLDDTASSPAFNFSKSHCALTKNQASMESVLDYSQGFSATHFEGRSAYKDHFGYMQPAPPLSGNQCQNNQWFGGRAMR